MSFDERSIVMSNAAGSLIVTVPVVAPPFSLIVVSAIASASGAIDSSSTIASVVWTSFNVP